MSDKQPTPMTDAVSGKVYEPMTEVCPAAFARQLERECDKLKAKLNGLSLDKACHKDLAVKGMMHELELMRQLDEANKSHNEACREIAVYIQTVTQNIHQIDELKQRAESAEKACAEKDTALRFMVRYFGQFTPYRGDPDSPPAKDLKIITDALSTTCGAHYVKRSVALSEAIGAGYEIATSQLNMSIHDGAMLVVSKLERMAAEAAKEEQQ